MLITDTFTKSDPQMLYRYLTPFSETFDYERGKIRFSEHDAKFVLRVEIYTYQKRAEFQIGNSETRVSAYVYVGEKSDKGLIEMMIGSWNTFEERLIEISNTIGKKHFLYNIDKHQVVVDDDFIYTGISKPQDAVFKFADTPGKYYSFYIYEQLYKMDVLPTWINYYLFNKKYVLKYKDKPTNFGRVFCRELSLVYPNIMNLEHKNPDASFFHMRTGSTGTEELDIDVSELNCERFTNLVFRNKRKHNKGKR